MEKNREVDIYCYGCKAEFPVLMNGSNLQHSEQTNQIIDYPSEKIIKCSCGSEKLNFKSNLSLKKSMFKK